MSNPFENDALSPDDETKEAVDKEHLEKIKEAQEKASTEGKRVEPTAVDLQKKLQEKESEEEKPTEVKTNKKVKTKESFPPKHIVEILDSCDLEQLFNYFKSRVEADVSSVLLEKAGDEVKEIYNKEPKEITEAIGSAYTDAISRKIVGAKNKK